MRCLLYPDESIATPFKLADDLNDLPASQLSFNGQRVIQIQQYLRAEYAQPFFRKNRLNTISFVTSRLSATLLDAHALIFDHEGDIPGVGVAEFQITDGVSSVWRWMDDAVVQTVELVEQIGITTKWRYTLVGGKITQTNPNQS